MGEIALEFAILAVVVAALVVGILVFIITKNATRKSCEKHYEETVGTAEKQAKDILDKAQKEAVKTAESTRKEALLQAKEENLKAKNELDREIKERRAEVQSYERRVTQKEENLDRKIEVLEKKEARMNQKESELDAKIAEADSFRERQIQELERISGLTSDKAKEYLLETVKNDVKHDTAVMIKEMEAEAKLTADKKAQELIVGAIQKCAADHVSEAAISVVQLPNDEMKGRIIGREGTGSLKKQTEAESGMDFLQSRPLK